MGEGPSIFGQFAEEGNVRDSSRYESWVKEHEDKLAGKDPYILGNGEGKSREQRKTEEIHNLFADFELILEENEVDTSTSPFAINPDPPNFLRHSENFQLPSGERFSVSMSNFGGSDSSMSTYHGDIAGIMYGDRARVGAVPFDERIICVHYETTKGGQAESLAKNSGLENDLQEEEGLELERSGGVAYYLSESGASAKDVSAWDTLIDPKDLQGDGVVSYDADVIPLPTDEVDLEHLHYLAEQVIGRFKTSGSDEDSKDVTSGEGTS